jgi:hypothetical protein
MNFQLKVEGIEEALAIVNPEALSRATVSALNRISDQAFTAANRLIRNDYNIKLKDLRANAYVRHATQRDMTAVISSYGKKGVSLLAFLKGSQTLRPVVVEIKKGSMTPLRHALVATMMSGFTGIFERTGKLTKTKQRQIAPMYGPSVTLLYGSRKVEREIRKTFEQKFADRQRRDYDYFIRK